MGMESRGGGIFANSSNQKSSISMRNINGTDNKVMKGGTIYAEANSMELISASFEGNSAINDGGSIWAIIHSNLTINSMKIKDSKAGDKGGGIYISYRSIFDSQFLNISSVTPPSSMILRNCNFTSNIDLNALYGGSIYVNNINDITLSNTKFE